MSNLTEDEAKTKWCPFARVGTSTAAGFAFNREARSEASAKNDLLPTPAMCIASRCMAWRVHLQAIRREATDRHAEAQMAAVARERKQELRIERGNWPGSGYDTLVVDAVGYCGMARWP